MAGMNGLAQANGGTSDPLSDRTVVPLETCLARALDGLTPVRAEWAETGAALGLILAEDLCLPQDMPTASEALRAGFAVAALDLVGASAGSPIPLRNPVRVVPDLAVARPIDVSGQRSLCRARRNEQSPDQRQSVAQNAAR